MFVRIDKHLAAQINLEHSHYYNIQFLMECPKCRSHSVRLEKGARVCGIKDCTFIDVHPISYDNDVMHYEGEDRRENRFTAIYSSSLAGGGIQLQKEANFDKNFKKGRKFIGDCCFMLKLNQNIIDTATARFLSILKIMNQEKQTTEKEGQKEELQEQNGGEEKTGKKRQRHKNILSLKNMAAYSIYSACFQKESYFQEFYLSKILGMNIKTWKDLVKEMNAILKGRIDFVPIVKPKHLIMRVCARRKIRKLQQLAMIQMCQNIANNATPDVRINTIAALAFWKVCEYSELYQGKVNLADFCKSHQKMQEEEGAPISQIQKYFDVTTDNVRKVFKEHIKADFFTKFLPNWQGRVKLHENNGNFQEN